MREFKKTLDTEVEALLNEIGNWVGTARTHTEDARFQVNNANRGATSGKGVVERLGAVMTKAKRGVGSGNVDIGPAVEKLAVILSTVATQAAHAEEYAVAITRQLESARAVIAEIRASVEA